MSTVSSLLGALSSFGAGIAGKPGTAAATSKDDGLDPVILEITSKDKPAERVYPSCDKAWISEVTRKILVENALDQNCEFAEPTVCKIKPKFTTACWSFRSPKHYMYIGEDLFQKDCLIENLSEKALYQYVKNHFKHEQGHARFTYRDLKFINEKLKPIKCPFGLYNLFEDATMEEQVRVADRYAFKWLTIEKMVLKDRPESILFGLIQAEGDSRIVDEEFQATLSKNAGFLFKITDRQGNPKENVDNQAVFLRVLEYYEEIIATKESLKLLPILEKWLEEFGSGPKGQPNNGGFADAGELENSMTMMSDEAAFEEFDSDTSDMDPAKKKEGKSSFGEFDPTLSSLVSQKGEVLQTVEREIDQHEVAKTVERLIKFFKPGTRISMSDEPSKRISVRHYIAGAPFYKKKVATGKSIKELLFVNDCSGSMGGYHSEQARVLIKALSELAKLKYIKGHVLVTAVKDQGAVWQLFKLPMIDADISRIEGFAGAEGLEYGISDNIQHAINADYVFVHTDAQICDKPINKRGLHQKGVYTWGLYVGDSQPRIYEKLGEFFDKSIIRDSAVELVDAMLTQNK